ncbi:MAG: glycosyltransferase [Actinomycetota bacterium]
MGVRRVAVIAYHSSPLLQPGSGDAGGMTIYVRGVAAALAELGVATDVFTRATSDLPRIGHLAPGVRAVCIEAGPPTLVAKEEAGGFVDQFAEGVQSFSLAQKIRYDVVHSHYWQSGMAAIPMARSWDVPLVHSSHTLGRVKNGSLPPGDFPESERRDLAEAEVVGAADVLVASTDYEWEELACLYGARHDALKTIHPGVDHKRFFPGDRLRARARLGLDPESGILLYAGRIQPLKGLSLAIEALGRMPEGTPAPLLLIVGGPSGPAGKREIDELKGLAAAVGVADRVRWLGPRPHEELPDLYRAADVVVVCSFSESFGFAALEAHTCGTPVVGTAVGGLSYVVKDGRSGFLLDARDPDLFAQRLSLILSRPDLRDELGANASSNARAFSWSATAHTLIELYDCLVRERHSESCVCL